MELASKTKKLPPGYREATPGEVMTPGVDYIKLNRWYKLVTKGLDSVVAVKGKVTYWKQVIASELGEALATVYELADQNKLTINNIDSGELLDEHKKQRKALSIVHDFIVNNFGEETNGP